MSKKIYVLDTSVYLTDFRSVFSYKTNDVCIPFIVLEEIDKHKKRLDGVGINARLVIRVLDQLRKSGSLSKGIRIRKGSGIIHASDFDNSLLPSGFHPSVPDHQIIATAMTKQRDNPNKKVIIVSCDINLRIKCDSVGIEVEDYTPNMAVKEQSQLYTGYKDVLVKDSFIDEFYDGKQQFINHASHSLYPNQFITLISNQDDKKTALARYIDDDKPLKRILYTKDKSDIFDIFPKNREQSFAADILMDPDVPVVSLIGRAGSGKSLLSIAAGLEQVIGENQRYNRLIVSRPIQPLGRDIGFLPGTELEKLLPWLKPIQDNLRFLFGNDDIMLQEYVDRKIIELEALTYIRGRSIQNSFIIIDESQNLSRHEMKTILTRVGNNSKIVLTGDIEQIDNVNINEITNGLSNVVEKMKSYSITGHTTLVSGERSAVASLASEVL